MAAAFQVPVLRAAPAMSGAGKAAPSARGLSVLLQAMLFCLMALVKRPQKPVAH
jgi:hypothetical protein